MNDENTIEARFGSYASNVRNAFVGGPFGSNLVSADYVSAGVPVIRGQNLGQGRWVSGKFAFVSPEKAESLKANWARPGDLVFTQRGTLGQVAIVPDGPWDKYVVSQSQMKVTLDRERADTLFVYYYFSNPREIEYILSNAIQTGVPHTNLAQLRNHPARFPDVAKQRAVARVLGTLDDKIEQNRRTAEVLERLARAIFKAWFVDFEPVRAKANGATSFPSVPQRIFDSLPVRLTESEIGPIPEGWDVDSVSSICSIVSGGTPKRSEPAYWNGDIPWYSIRSAPAEGQVWVSETAEQITESGLANSPARMVPKGCTIISARGTVGKLAMAAIPMAFNQTCYGLLPSDMSSYSYIFLVIKNAVADLQQRSYGSVFDTITKPTFDELLIPMAPSRIVIGFESVVEPLFELMLQLSRESSSLTELRDYLLPQMLSGQVRVGSADG